MPLKNLPAGESPLHLWTHDFDKIMCPTLFWGMENRDFCSFFCEFLLPASSASSLRSAPGGIVAAPEQPFLAAQALSPCDAARTTGCGILSQPRWAGFLPLSRRSETKTDAPVVSRFFYRLTPATVCRTQFFAAIRGVFLLVFFCVCGEAGIFFALARKLTRMFAAVFGVWVCCTLLFAA